jgi:hypothetical protein
MPTNFGNQASILADLWINFRAEEDFSDFIEYNDIGLPLAYFIHTDLVSPSDQAKQFVEETFNLLCSALGLDLNGEYESLNEMFDKSNNVE